jgi:transposase
VYSSSVTDAEWAILEPLLPAPGSTAGRGGRPEKHCRRVIVDAILYIVRGGIAWRQLPVEFPPAGTVYAVFARWARSGAWQRILDALRDRLRVRAGRDRCPTAAIIDSQTVPAADTVPRSSRGWDGGKRTNGVKRPSWRQTFEGLLVAPNAELGYSLLTVGAQRNPSPRKSDQGLV